MPLSDLVTKAAKLIKANSPEILTALGVTGVVTTSYLVGKASFKASKKIEQKDAVEGVTYDQKQRVKENVKLTWQFYIPAVVSGVATVGCIICGSKASGRRTAAAVTAYSLTERAFSEYKDKVVEQIGANKEQAVRDEIAQDRVNANPPPTNGIVVVGSGDILCREDYTGRYFMSDMETLRKAQNDINAKVLRDNYVNLNEFYYLIGLAPTQKSDILGWNFERNMELNFSHALDPNGRPCLTFEYNYVKPI